MTRYDPAGSSRQLAELIDQVRRLGATHAYVEAPYVDFDYRAEYSNMYARSFRPPPDKTERLLFFRGGQFLGFSVMRPSHKPVGRTAVVPQEEDLSRVTCLAPHRVHPFGEEHVVQAYPFLSQDGQYGRCAHAAIWSIARYHHLAHRTARYSIAAVVDAAGTKEPVDRTFPSEGLYLHQVAGAFHGLGLPSKPYDPRDLPEGESMDKVICRYLNSRFPVAVNTSSHLTVLVGYGHEDGRLFFIRADDNVGPYERVWADQDDRLGKWEMLLVPFPVRIHVAGEAAEISARLTFLQESGATEDTLPLRRELEKGDIELRTYAVEAAEYKKRLADRGLPDAVVAHHRFVPLSSWIWVTEFRRAEDLEKDEKVYAEVAIDATSHASRPRPLVAHMPHRCVAWLPEDLEPRAMLVPAEEEPYLSALDLA